jgi:2-polyprenyl-6-methoxyphenol hydroxylase-like FAD-dependent oxidoreductase
VRRRCSFRSLRRSAASNGNGVMMGTYHTAMPRQTVLVSGVGIAGCTIAYWLRRRGFTPVLIERAPRFREGGYIIDFWGIGFDVAERMGLIPELRGLGYTFNRIEFVGKDGRTRSAIGGNSFERALGDRFFSIPRGDLARAIYGTIEGKVETVFGDSIVGIRSQKDCAQVVFASGSPRAFDLVIGADGLHSAVGTAIFGPHDKFERYLGYYAATFSTTGYPRRDENTYLSYAAPGRQISRYALRDDRTAFLFVFASPSLLPAVTRDPAVQKALLLRTFSQDAWIEWPQIEKRLDTCDDLYLDAVSQVETPNWSKDRVALVGDAAYCPSLLAGEGAAFAMAGAYVLALELGRTGGDYTAAFASYERQFRPFIESKQKSARAFSSSFAPKSSLGLFIRDQILRLSAVPAVADWIMRRYVTDSFVLPE